jgi:hypothetical protein
VTSRKSRLINNELQDSSFEYDKYWFFDDFHSDFSHFCHHEIFCEYTESNIKISDYSVKGRLKHALEFWETSIQPNNDILSCIKSGYVIPFLSQPPSFFMRNNKSALENSDFVDKAIEDLLQKQCVYEVPFLPHNINPLSVATNSSGKKRLILDLSILNTYVKKDRIKFEDYKVAKELLFPSGFMYKFDLSSGYHHISIKPIHHSYLGFSWFFHGKCRYFVFSVLPFGLSSAPFIFTKLLRPLVKFWRLKGLRIVLFLDDGWGINKSFEHALCDANFVSSTLLKAGFLINKEKSVFVPVQRLEWLGFIWDLQHGTLKIPDRRIENTLSCIRTMKSSFPRVTARKLAQLSGKIVSMMPVLGNVALLQTKSFYQLIERRVSWDSVMNISECYLTVQFWESQLSKPFSKKLFKDFLPSVIAYSDASNVAGAAFLVECDKVIAHRAWTEFEQNQSSTYRELLAIHYGLNSFVSKLAGKQVIWYTDSKNCVSILEKGSLKLTLQELSLHIFRLCAKYSISLDINWIQRDNNKEADMYSRLIDYDDYGISQDFFSFIDHLYGPHTVDRFANDYNNKLPRFNSLYFTPSSENVDAFTVNWGSENNLIVPPVYLIPKALNHLLYSKANGTLVAPYWPSSPFFPMIFGETSNLKQFVCEILLFNDPKDIYVQGRNKETIFGSTYFTSKVIVARIECC